MGEMKKLFAEQREQEQYNSDDQKHYDDAFQYQQWLNEKRLCDVYCFVVDAAGELCVIQGSSIQHVYDIAEANNINGELRLVFPSKSLT